MTLGPSLAPRFRVPLGGSVVNRVIAYLNRGRKRSQGEVRRGDVAKQKGKRALRCGSEALVDGLPCVKWSGSAACYVARQAVIRSAGTTMENRSPRVPTPQGSVTLLSPPHALDLGGRTAPHGIPELLPLPEPFTDSSASDDGEGPADRHPAVQLEPYVLHRLDMVRQDGGRLV